MKGNYLILYVTLTLIRGMIYNKSNVYNDLLLNVFSLMNPNLIYLNVNYKTILRITKTDYHINAH